MYKIYAVCASGIGTSLFARKLITESIKELGYDTDGFLVSCIGVGEAKSMPANMFITGESLAKNIPARDGIEIVTVMNMINDKVGMKKALEPILEKAAAEGKINKL